MKLIVCALCLAFLVGCASMPDSKAVESAILWETKLDPTWTPLAMAKAVKNAKLYEPKGNFYKVNGDLLVFGHRASYVGMLGVDLFAGPNAVLKGTPESIVQYITKHHGTKFKDQGEMFVCDYKKDIKILVGKHPNIEGASIVIGAYTGL